MEKQFLTLAMDHLLVHWGTCAILYTFDFFINCCGLRRFFKLHSRDSSPDSLQNILMLVLFNQFCVTFPLFYMGCPLPEGSVFEWSNLLRIPVAFAVLDILFYYTHVILHDPVLYYIHKIHHRWIHPSCISTTYAHPVEHAVSNVLPIMIGVKLSGMNFATARVWHAITLLNALIVSHGGYSLPGDLNNHDLHHTRKDCNFGISGILDNLHGTYQYPGRAKTRKGN